MILVKKTGYFCLNIQNIKNDSSLFSLRNIKIMQKMQKNFFGILVQTALIVGQFWTIEKITPKSALLSLTILYTLSNLCKYKGLPDFSFPAPLNCDTYLRLQGRRNWGAHAAIGAKPVPSNDLYV